MQQRSTSALGHVWTAPWQELSDGGAALVGCGHVSGLLMRRVWPLALTLQLRSPFYVGSAGFGLMCASPEGPCDDVGGPDASLRKTNSDAPDFLN